MPAQKLPEQYRLNFNSILVAWSFLYPFLTKRAAATASLWDDRLIAIANQLLSNQDFVKLLEEVFNGDKDPSALQLEAPPELRMQARAFAGNYEFVEGWLRDTISAMQMSSYVNVPVEGETADAATAQAVRSQMSIVGSTGAGLTQPVSMSQAFDSQRQRQMQQVGYANQPSIQSAVQQNIGAVSHTGGYPGAPDTGPQSVAPTGFAQVYAEKQHLPIPDYVAGQYVQPQQQAQLVPAAQQVGSQEQQEWQQRQEQQYSGPAPADEPAPAQWLGEPRTSEAAQGQPPQVQQSAQTGVGTSGYEGAPTHRVEWLNTPATQAGQQTPIQQTAGAQVQQVTQEQWEGMSEQQKQDYQAAWMKQQQAQQVQATPDTRDKTHPVEAASQQQNEQALRESEK